MSIALEPIEPVVDETLEKLQVPGIAIAVMRRDEEPSYIFRGTDANGKAVDAASLFPVASISKLATALTVLCLIDAGALEPDDELSKFVPEAAAAEQGVTISTLLCHTSGLPNDLPRGPELYESELDWSRLARECLRVPLEHAPRQHVQYSNVGYGLLAVVVERVTQDEFRNVLRRMVLEPLGINGMLGNQYAVATMKLADVRSRHTDTTKEPFNSDFWQELGLPWAGLYTNVDGALSLVRAFKHGTLLSQSLRQQATTNQAGDLAGGYGGIFNYSNCPWGWGPDLHGNKSPHWAPTNSSPDTFGHAGASGCVAWWDPVADVGWAILGTRTAENGWLVRGGKAIAAAILKAAE